MNSIQKNSQPPSLPPQKNPLPWWLVRLLIIASLVLPPTLVAAFSKNAVFIYLKVWGIEYQFQKGNIIPPKQ